MRMLTLASGLLIMACAHAREAEDPSAAQAATEARANEEGPSEPPEQERAAGAAAQTTGSQKAGQVAGGPSKPNEVPVASSPSGLLKPGAEQKVRDKLGVEGGGDSLREALQKFQKAHDLPATGILDQRTVQALGLDPDEVFERAGDH